MRYGTLFVLLLAAVGSAACSGSDVAREREDAAMSGEVASASAPAPPASAPEGVGAAVAFDSRVAADESRERTLPQGPQALPDSARPPMLIRNGGARVEVDSLETAIAAVRALAQRLGGHVTGVAQQSGREQLREATLTLRLPSTRFDEALNGLEPIGEVEAVNESSEDVGEEYYDIEARLANARRLEQRLLELLERRTGALEDVLAVERELARVREQIERLEGRLRYLRNRVELSTLVVTVHEPGPLIARSPGDNIILRAFRQALRNFVGFLATFIAALGVLIPLGALAVVVWLGVSRVWRSRRRAAAET